ncbi:phenylalanine--tRNA ligase subunit beta [Candidatus Uhrbacteria bacterium]|nr:phenylalanine--tRNA ligase subunit beta [Candidatus Uhrbacteria bacterium]
MNWQNWCAISALAAPTRLSARVTASRSIRYCALTSFPSFMNLSVPYSWLSEYLSLPKSPKELAASVSLAGPSIDRVRQELGEWILEAEITTNRPDSFSLFGFAREVAAIMGTSFRDMLSDAEVRSHYADYKKKASGGYSLTISNQNHAACPRYCGVVIDHVKVAPSPQWMQKRLALSGMRPINNIVDITNYVMLELGQPLHAFDADLLIAKTNKGEVSLRHKKIIVRNARNGESLVTLDGDDKKLTSDMLVIADDEGPLAIAGIKGGMRSGITNATRTIVVESASFEPVGVRTTSRVLDLRTDSSSRYERGLSPEYSSRCLLRAIELIRQLAGGTVATPIADAYPKKEKSAAIRFDPSDIVRIIGISIPIKDIVRIVRSLGFAVKKEKTFLTVTPPFWRANDCTGSHDLVEETARIYGYAKVPTQLLTGEIPPIEVDGLLVSVKEAKYLLQRNGWTEIITYSGVGSALLEKAGFDPKAAVAILNPLSEEFACLRTSLLPGLLNAAASNEQKRAELKLYELSKVYHPAKRKNSLPSEQLMLSGILMKKESSQNVFREIKGTVEALCDSWFSRRVRDISFHLLDKTDPFWEKGSAARILWKGSHEVGYVGFVSELVRGRYGIKTPFACFDIAFEVCYPHFSNTVTFTPLPKYPRVARDIAFIVNAGIPYDEIVGSLSAFDKLVYSVELFDVFEGKAIGNGKRSLAFHIIYSSDERTLHAEEVDQAHEKLQPLLQERFGAIIRQ